MDNAPQQALVATILDSAEESLEVSSTSNLMRIQKHSQEILDKIFSFLDYDGLKAAMLCCRAWRELGSSPLLWRDIKIPPIQAENLEQVRLLHFSSCSPTLDPD